MSDHRIRSEKFGIDHRRAGAHFVSIRPWGRSRATPGSFLSRRVVRRPDGRTLGRRQGRRSGKGERETGTTQRAPHGEELGPSRLIRGLADADIHIACRRRHIYWHLYTLPLKHCSSEPRRGSPQMNKVFRALGVPLSLAGVFIVVRVDVYSADDFALAVSPMIDVEITLGDPTSRRFGDFDLYVFPSTCRLFLGFLLPRGSFCRDSSVSRRP